MDGWDYEKECAKYIATLGFTDIQVTPGSGDFGCDILAFKDGKKYGIQCKYYDEGKIGVKAVQEAVAGSIFYDCDIPMVITNVSFTDNAIAYAKKCQAELMSDLDAVQIITALKNKSQSQKEEAPVLLRNIDDFVYVLKAYRDKKKIAEAEKLQKDLQEDLLEDICQCLLKSQYEQACNRIKNELAKKDKILSDDYLRTLYKMTEKRWQVICTLTDYMEQCNIDTIREHFPQNGFGCITLDELKDMVHAGLIECENRLDSNFFPDRRAWENEDDPKFYEKGLHKFQEDNLTLFDKKIDLLLQDVQERVDKEHSVLLQKKNHDIEACENERKSLESRILEKKEEINHCFVFSFSRKNELTEQLSCLEKELSNLPSINDIILRNDMEITQLRSKAYSDENKMEKYVVELHTIFTLCY